MSSQIAPFEARIIGYGFLALIGCLGGFVAYDNNKQEHSQKDAQEDRVVSLQFEVIKSQLEDIKASTKETSGVISNLQQQLSSNANLTNLLMRDIQEVTRRVDKLEKAP